MGGEQGAAEVTFGLLGPLELRVAGVPLTITGIRRRALLARLLVDANRVVPAERLIDDLWFENAPEHPAHALQAYVSHLRSVLEPGRAGRPQMLMTRRPGYLLAVEPGALDTARFIRLVAEGQAASAFGRPADAAKALGEALRLSRGPPLAEFAEEGWARPEVARLVDMRWTAVEDRMEAELALGRHASVVAEAEAATAEQPLRERLWAHRMLALYRCGRQAEALRTYSELRRVLGEELGIDPSPALARLEEAILVQKPELDWRPEDPAPPDRPVPVHRAPPPHLQAAPLPLVGRRAELDRLRQIWAAVGDGCRAVLLAGEPGVGKTRLAHEIAGEAFSDGGLVLTGRCDEGMGVPYQPFVEALRRFVDDTADDDLTSQLGPSAGELTRVLPELAGRLPQLAPPLATEPATERYRLFVAIAGWLTAASRVSPALLIIDDLHWATKPTVLLLRHILRSADAMRLVVVATCRDTEVGQNRSVTAQMTALAREPGVVALPLEGLGEAEVAELITAVGGDGNRGLARAIHAETRGNPFFVGEMVRHLAETGAVCESVGAAERGAGLGIPAGVRAVVADRLARVAPATYDVLSMAAVAGLEFDLALMRTALNRPADAMIGALEEAAKARLVEETPGPALRYRFVHGLVQSTIYGAMGRARRADQHRRVGEAIEAVHKAHLGEYLPELSRHFGEAAVDGDTDKAASYAQAAGDTAMAQLAHDEAVDYYERALALQDDHTRTDVATCRRARLLILLGEAQRRAGRRGYRATLLQGASLAAACGDAALLCQAALANNRGFFSLAGSVDAERVKVLEQALAAQRPCESGDRARLLALLGTELIFAGDWEKRVALSNQALTMAESLGQPETIVHVLNLRFATLWAAPTLAERLKTTANARALAARLSDPVPGFYCSMFGVHAALEAGDLDAATILLAKTHEAASELGQPIINWYAAITAAKMALVTAPLAEAERLIMLALAAGQEVGQPDALMWTGVQLAQLRRHQGRASEVVAYLEVYLAEPLTGSLPMFAKASLAACYSEIDRLDEAKALVEAITAEDLEDLPRDFGWLPTAAMAAQACWTVGGCEGAEAIRDLLTPYRDQFVDAGPGWLGSVAHYVGLIAAVLGRTKEADDAFAQAAEAHTRLGAHTWLATTQAAWAVLLLAAGSPAQIDRGRAVLLEAHTTARSLGMIGLERRAAACLIDPDSDRANRRDAAS